MTKEVIKHIKILYIGRYPPFHPKAYGGDIHLYKIAEETAKLGNEAFFLNVAATRKTRYMQLKRGRYIRHRGTPFYPDSRTIIETVSRFKPDLVHYESCWGYTLEKLRFDRDIEKPTVASIFASRLAAAKLRKPIELLLLKQKPYRWLTVMREKFCAQHASIVVTTSNAMKKRTSSDYDISQDKIKKIPRGVDHELFLPTLLPKDRVLLSVARLEFEKGIHHILKSVALASRKIKDLRLLVVGEGKDKEKLKKIAEVSGINDRTIFVGRVSHNEMPKIYAKSKLVLLYSTWEPFGATLLEAMACARPVISSESGGPRDIITPDCGLLVPPEKPIALSEVIVDIIQKEERMKEMGLQGRKRILKKYTWKNKAEEYLKIYSRTLRKSS
jgi:glycosyltransferase involved in cell wall biosynthesis